ncbi:MAG: short-chain dehydrogenase, partial [Lachnospiraceae bacterium]
MKIAIVTGASSGMGKEFAQQIARRYSGLQEIWVIARR